MKRLYDVLKDCKKEEEVKSEFCKFFKMKINALKAIDHYTETILFEFKYDRNFKSAANIAAVVAQTMYYARLLKLGLTKYPLPPHICVVDKNEAFFVETKAYAKFYASTAQKYDWDRAASTPCPNLVADIAAFEPLKSIYVYDLTNLAEEDQFVAKCREFLTTQLLTANEDRFLAKWLKNRTLSPEAQAVLDEARVLYKTFYAEIVNTNWIDYKIQTWGVGYYQICQALKETGIAVTELAALKSAHDALRTKLLPKVYEYGFLNPDVQLFQ